MTMTHTPDASADLDIDALMASIAASARDARWQRAHTSLLRRDAPAARDALDELLALHRGMASDYLSEDSARWNSALLDRVQRWNRAVTRCANLD